MFIEHDIALIDHDWGYTTCMCTGVRAQTIQHARQGRTLDYSPVECQECLHHLQAVVACNATALKVCTLVLFIRKAIILEPLHLCVEQFK